MKSSFTLKIQSRKGLYSEKSGPATFYFTFPNVANIVGSRTPEEQQEEEQVGEKEGSCSFSKLPLLPVGNACSDLSAALIIIGLFDKNAAWRALIKRAGFAAGLGGERGHVAHSSQTSHLPKVGGAHPLNLGHSICTQTEKSK